MLQRRTNVRAALGAAVLIAGCSESLAPEPDPELPAPDLTVVEVMSGLGAPTHLTSPAGDDRLFVSELHGQIFVIRGGSRLETPFLDLRPRVSRSGEQGFFGVAFHPQYATNGYFYVSYTDLNGATRIERYQVSEDPDIADPSSAKLILLVPQPTANHNGGNILFGPDGMLYISIGDGGSAVTAQNAQLLENLLGTVLRIDVNTGDPYSIPSDNPFASHPSARKEIWAYGLRNPWRFSFDGQSQLAYIADVGEIDREEVNIVPMGQGGYNFGWNLMEASLCYPPDVAACNTAGLTLPAYEYPHVRLDPENGGRSVIGGYVYRGDAIPGLQGHYVHADFSGWVQTFRYRDGKIEDRRRWDFDLPDNSLILGMGQDGSGELYVLTHVGFLFRIVEAE